MDWFGYSPQITCRRAAWPAPGTDSRPSSRSDTCRQRASRTLHRASAGRAPRCTPRPPTRSPRTWARSSCCPHPHLHPRPRLRAPPDPHGPGGRSGSNSWPEWLRFYLKWKVRSLRRSDWPMLNPRWQLVYLPVYLPPLPLLSTTPLHPIPRPHGSRNVTPRLVHTLRSCRRTVLS